MSAVKSIIATSLSIILFGAMVFGYGQYVRNESWTIQTRIDEQQLQLVNLRTRIDKFLMSEAPSAYPPEIFWPATSQADAELLLQDWAVELAHDQGLNLTSFGSQPVNFPTGLDTMGISLEIKGTLTQFYQFLNRLELKTPLVGIQNLRIRGSENYDQTEKTVYFQLIVWGYWSATGGAS